MLWGEAIRRRRHTALLVAIVTAFGTRPLIGDAGAAPYIYSIALLLLMLVALYAIQVDELVGDRVRLLAARRRRGIVGWTLAVVAIAERLATTVSANPILYRISTICWMLFFGFVTWTELRSVLRQKEITTETISMSISVYLLFGVTWGMLYAVIFELHPDAFSLGGAPLQASNPQQLFPVFVYFSFTTLSTIGYGDIAPVTLQARYAAVAEGITGQFYLAILVARLVGMQMSSGQAHAREPGKPADRDR
jgi:voltage-gated potassium channel